MDQWPKGPLQPVGPDHRLPPITISMFLGIFAFLLVISFGPAFYFSQDFPVKRTEAIRQKQERVLILGASSGIGKDLALSYAARGAKIFLLARRESELNSVKAECEALYPPGATDKDASKVIAVVGDVTNVDDLIKCRDTIETSANGLDTVIIASGVVTTQPLLKAAGINVPPAVKIQYDPYRSSFEPPPPPPKPDPVPAATAEGVKAVIETAKKAMEVNFLGVVAIGAVFIPLLSNTSPQPTILLLSSVAALIPAPTRALYTSTKAAGLSLLLSLGLEVDQPKLQGGCNVRVLGVLPGTVSGTGLRASALDAENGDDAKTDESWSKLAVTPRKVSEACIELVDSFAKSGTLKWLPNYPYSYAHSLYYSSNFGRWIVSRGARNKYKKEQKKPTK